MSTTAQIHANRANAQSSTGPATPEGKAASSRNAFRHGLASRQLIIPGEDPAAYDALLADLTAEHSPQTTTEQLLVTQMAQNFWFIQRCIRLHQDSFDRIDMSKQVPVTSMPLLVRYETSANRAFHKALSTLLSLQKTRKKEPIGSVSQNSSQEEAEHQATPPPPEPLPAAKQPTPTPESARTALTDRPASLFGDFETPSAPRALEFWKKRP